MDLVEIANEDTVTQKQTSGSMCDIYNESLVSAIYQWSTSCIKTAMALQKALEFPDIRIYKGFLQIIAHIFRAGYSLLNDKSRGQTLFINLYQAIANQILFSMKEGKNRKQIEKAARQLIKTIADF